jgi:hypothetical protein
MQTWSLALRQTMPKYRSLASDSAKATLAVVLP